MVVLTAITLFGRRWLHKENYSFKEQMNVSSSRTEDVLDSSPSQYWLLGFKDRNLEEEYLNDLVDVSKDRLYLGYGMCTFFVFAHDLVPKMLAVILGKNHTVDQRNAHALALYSIVFAAFIAGLISR